MNKVIVTIICIIVIIGAMFTAIMIMKPKEKDNPQKVETKVSETILDDCTDEYEEIEKNDMLAANSEEEKISPNCSFTLKTYYKKCGHTKEEYLELPSSLVNHTKDELQEKYKEFTIEKFASNEIILFQEASGECGEHYKVKNKDGIVTIFRILEDGTEEELEKTDITTEYLPESDKLNMEQGISINGRQSLNRLIEDFE